MSIFPKMAKIKLRFEAPEIVDVRSELLKKISGKDLKIKEGSRIGIALGSRGIYKIKDMVEELIAFLRDNGVQPVILPAMGSHGGANAEGQKEVLAGYGISEEALGVPVLSGMETICIGQLKDNIPVYFDKIASELDGIIMVNRVKAHTDFHAQYESGLMKQMVIGLGNHQGAQNIHSYGLYGLTTLIPKSAKLILEKMPIILGIAIIENAKDHTAEIHVLSPEEIPLIEPELLVKSKKMLPFIPFNGIDVLVVEETGKNISGVGMDPNITGRIFSRFVHDNDIIGLRRIVCLDLTPESHGNALGIGIADVIPKRLYDKINFETTYANVITSGLLERGFTPIVQKNDYEAMKVALNCCGRKTTPENARILQIKNTLKLEEMFVSLPLLKDISDNIKWEKCEEFSYQFSDEGDLLNKLQQLQ